jgi:hypothetical protein
MSSPTRYGDLCNVAIKITSLNPHCNKVCHTLEPTFAVNPSPPRIRYIKDFIAFLDAFGFFRYNRRLTFISDSLFFRLFGPSFLPSQPSDQLIYLFRQPLSNLFVIPHCNLILFPEIAFQCPLAMLDPSIKSKS